MLKNKDKRYKYIMEMLRRVDLEFDNCNLCKSTVIRMSDIYDELKDSIPGDIKHATVEYGELICRLMIEQRRFYYLCGIRDSRLGLKVCAKNILSRSN